MIRREVNILSNTAAIIMNIAFTIGIILFVAITMLAVITSANHHFRSIALFVVGIVALFAMSFAGTQSIDKSDLHQVTCKHYKSYEYDRYNEVYTIGHQQFSADGNNDSIPADIQSIVTSKKQSEYKAEVVTFELSKEQKYSYLHSFNFSKQMAAYMNPHQYIINIVKNK